MAELRPYQQQIIEAALSRKGVLMTPELSPVEVLEEMERLIGIVSSTTCSPEGHNQEHVLCGHCETKKRLQELMGEERAWPEWEKAIRSKIEEMKVE